uniref:Uncharacterized protein n=1 Tax=Cacopsylla melanoneura TaxID=428564 RepID=A0A8D8QKS0_9HEMI
MDKLSHPYQFTVPSIRDTGHSVIVTNISSAHTSKLCQFLVEWNGNNKWERQLCQHQTKQLHADPVNVNASTVWYFVPARYTTEQSPVTTCQSESQEERKDQCSRPNTNIAQY